MQRLTAHHGLDDPLGPYLDVAPQAPDGRPWVLVNMVCGLAHGLVDELCLTLAPVAGGDPLPVAVMPATAPVERMRLAHVLEADGNLFLRYEAR